MMTRAQLKQKLDRDGVNPCKYSLDGSIPYASEGVVLCMEGGKWVINMFERGLLSEFGKFDNESDACFRMACILSDPFY